MMLPRVPTRRKLSPPSLSRAGKRIGVPLLKSVIPSEGPDAQRKATNRGISVCNPRDFSTALEMAGWQPKRFLDYATNELHFPPNSEPIRDWRRRL